MPSTRTVAITAFLVGVLVGAGLVATAVPTEPRIVDPANPPYSVASATGCIEEPGGWFLAMNDERGRVVVVNLTLAHPPAQTLDHHFQHVGDGRYLFSLTTTDEGTAGSPDCPTGTTVELAATLPGDFDTVTVVRDGEQISTIGNPGETGPTHRVLDVE